MNQMIIGLTFLGLCFLVDNGVCGDDVPSVSVTEGDSVTLHTDFIKQKDDKIMWYYGPENTFVARINGKVTSTLYSDEERFRDRLRLNDRTGDLIISDSRTSDSGLYTLKISTNRKVFYKKFILTVRGVFEEAEDSILVSVRKGHSLILYTHVLKERSDALIEWRFGPENIFVAKINETGFTPSLHEMFKDKVKLDDQTGALMINETERHHSGLHTFRININNKVLYKKFEVSIHSEDSTM